MRKHIFAALLTAAALAAVSFTALAEDNAEVPVIGSDASGQNFGCLITNGTSQDITGLSLRVNYGDFSENLLTDGAVIAPEGQVHFYCTPGEMVNFVPAVYDIEVTYADETKGVLHTLPMGDTDEITVKTGRQETGEAEEAAEEQSEAEENGGEVTYVSFTSLSLGYEMDTLRKETEIADLGEAFLKADYESKITYTGGSSWSGGSSGSSGGSSGGGNNGGGDGCLTDGILF